MIEFASADKTVIARVDTLVNDWTPTVDNPIFLFSWVAPSGALAQIIKRYLTNEFAKFIREKEKTEGQKAYDAGYKDGFAAGKNPKKQK